MALPARPSSAGRAIVSASSASVIGFEFQPFEFADGFVDHGRDRALFLLRPDGMWIARARQSDDQRRVSMASAKRFIAAAVTASDTGAVAGAVLPFGTVGAGSCWPIFFSSS